MVVFALILRRPKIKIIKNSSICHLSDLKSFVLLRAMLPVNPHYCSSGRLTLVLMNSFNKVLRPFLFYLITDRHGASIGIRYGDGIGAGN